MTTGNHHGASKGPIPFEQLLKHNHYGIIENPLRRIPEDRLSTHIESFYRDWFGLADVVDLDTLVRGARLARDEEAFMVEEGVDGCLTKVEKAALDKEKVSSIWTESRELKIILLTCCVGSVLQGWVSEPFSDLGSNITTRNPVSLAMGSILIRSKH